MNEGLSGQRIRTAWLDLDPNKRLLASMLGTEGGLAGEVATGPLRQLLSTPLLTLIEGVHRLHPDSARHHLRKPIGVNGEATFAEKMLVKVAAKRLRFEESLPALENTHIQVLIPGSAPSLNTPLPTERIRTGADLRRTLEALKISAAEGMPRYLQDRPISAALIDRDGHVLFTARNEGGTVRCLHAEMNLLRQISLQHPELPADTLIAVSLKPCRMCAAFLVSAASDLRDVRVIALENDPGTLAAGTALEKASPGRLEFLRERNHLLPSAAKSIIRDPDFSQSLQVLACEIRDFDQAKLDELWTRFV